MPGWRDGRRGLRGTRVGAALDGAIRGARRGDAQVRLPPSVVVGRSALGLRQAPDRRGGDLSTQEFLLFGTPPRQEFGRAVDALSGRGRGLHLRLNGSTTPSADRCATWRSCSYSSLHISRLRGPRRGELTAAVGGGGGYHECVVMSTSARKQPKTKEPGLVRGRS
jgi:hypothetical protein